MWTLMDSPVGELRLVEEEGAITAIHFAPDEARADDGGREDTRPVLVEAVRQLRAYFAGELEEFDLPLAPAGTPFQAKVWEQLRTIPYGETLTYGQIALRLGLTGHGSRAVGLANGRNPIPIVVPCHRVIGANGTLTGYAGGLARKQTLLELEQTGLF
ncbi:methylated-DNA--[protein]-cysteine S-methyltransferase [Nocardioides panaciterrulae]|uniref:Methylated-DNA--protein-cysteine methyltransferase n=1 Tax=Nocardioides panaciterrulae TaxID=661492 RepID=A0A7Y9E7S9_9ACTN|nr:methylated-DNA--[protein]-cysteine S-methyltransferase [Nocardioides panaciterrulae]NYD42466.1 methylated-DNA-[protein]-cysteine S-methyltransferase [Nocardioides panaciterrulae]